MNNRRGFRQIVKISREGSAQKSLLPKFFGALRLFILLFLFSSNVFAQNIQNQQYDINDPRNPNCPCHKLQQMADDEYNRIQNDWNSNIEQQQLFALNVRNFNQLDNNGNENDNTSNQVKRDFNFKGPEISFGSGSSGSRIKKKKSGTSFYKKLNKAKLKHSRIKKARPNYSVCYKW